MEESISIELISANDSCSLHRFVEGINSSPKYESGNTHSLSFEELHNELTQEKSHPQAFFCTLNHNQVLGGVILSQKPIKGESAINISRLFVLKDFRRRKIGTRLLEFSRGYALTQGCKFLTLDVHCSNIPAYRLYARFGFCRWSIFANARGESASYKMIYFRNCDNLLLRCNILIHYTLRRILFALLFDIRSNPTILCRFLFPLNE